MSDRPRGFKTRFSLLSLLPARHPPLQPLPPPLPPTHHVGARQPTILSVSDGLISPAHSEYPDTAFSAYTSASPLPPVPTRSVHSAHSGSTGRKAYSPSHRPPPLDLSKTHRAYPGLPGVIPTAGTVVPDPQPKAKVDGRDKKGEERKSKGKAKRPKPPRVDDPFDVVEIESAHRYPSWQGGRVSIKPGQVIPHHISLHGTPTIRGQDSNRRSSRATSSYLAATDQYESVLHNVLLTPTYVGRSPVLPPTPSPCSSRGDRGEWFDGRRERRNTLLNAVKRGSKWMKSTIKDDQSQRGVRAMKEREHREMERFRMDTRHVRINSDVAHDDGVISFSTGKSPNGYGSNIYSRRSPATREWNLGVTWGDTKGKDASAEKAWRERRQEEERLRKKQRVWKVGIVIIILILAGLTIGLCTSLLTNGSSEKEKTSASPSASAEPADQSGSVSPSASESTAPSASPTPISRTLATCLDTFSRTASSSPLTYPCGDCVSLLSSTENDYTQSLVAANSSGVGAALQFCAMMDIYRATSSNGLHESGWMKDGSPCGWSGIQCDDRGRVIELQMKYPDTPSTIPTSLSNLVSLQTLRLMGNTTSPTGNFPSNLLALPNITTLDIEYTALTGPFPSIDVGQAKSLVTLYLVNNQQLGSFLPNLSGNSVLKTLAVTGQGLVNITDSELPSSLSYLDLSYNALSGSMPSFPGLSSLQTLYLSNNAYASPPPSLPGSLTSLSLTANPDLSGPMPADVCANAALTNCDLRSTKLMGPNLVPGALSGFGIGTASGSSSSVASSTSTTPTSTSAASFPTGKSCGVCRFD